MTNGVNADNDNGQRQAAHTITAVNVNNTAIPMWNGVVGELTYDQWREDIEACFYANEWDNREAVYNILRSTRNPLRNKLRAFAKGQYPNKESILAALDRAVLGADVVDKANDILAGAKRAQNMSIDEYCAQLDWAMRNTDLGRVHAEKRAIRTFKLGHNMPELALQFSVREFATLEEIQKAANDMITMTSHFNRSMGPAANNYQQFQWNGFQHQNQQNTQSTANTQGFHQNFFQNNNASQPPAEPMEIGAVNSNACFICKKNGHWQRECPDRQAGRGGRGGFRGRGGRGSYNNASYNSGSTRGRGSRGNNRGRARGRGNWSSRGGHDRRAHIQELEAQIRELELERRVEELQLQQRDNDEPRENEENTGFQ